MPLCLSTCCSCPHLTAYRKRMRTRSSTRFIRRTRFHSANPGDTRVLSPSHLYATIWAGVSMMSANVNKILQAAQSLGDAERQELRDCLAERARDKDQS